MSFSHWISVAVVAFMPLAATAQQPQHANPADANAPVPAIGYVSAFENYRTTPTEKDSPDQVWHAANEEIASQDMRGGPMAMPGMEPAASGNHMSVPGMGPGAAPAASGNHMPMPRVKKGTSGNDVSVSGMGPVKPETKAGTPKADTPTADPHAGHHHMQGK